MRQIFIEFHLVFKSGISYKKIQTKGTLAAASKKYSQNKIISMEMEILLVFIPGILPCVQNIFLLKKLAKLPKNILDIQNNYSIRSFRAYIYISHMNPSAYPFQVRIADPNTTRTSIKFASFSQSILSSSFGTLHFWIVALFDFELFGMNDITQRCSQP